jgi:septum formation protein
VGRESESNSARTVTALDDPARPLILASASPRRRDLLALLGAPLTVLPLDVDESVGAGEGPHAYLERVTRAKLAAALARPLPERACVVVADTIVVSGGRIVDKPEHDEEARNAIRALSGGWHEVSTRFAIALLPRGQPAAHEETVTTRVLVRKLESAWIDRYVASGEGRDKAGAYAIQGLFAAVIPRIEGSYTNVVGLPLSEVAAALEKLGVLGGSRGSAE